MFAILLKWCERGRIASAVRPEYDEINGRIQYAWPGSPTR
jgi:hypothetical protein